MQGFIHLRNRATSANNRVLAKGFKGAANTFLGCMKHVFPRVQNRYVLLLKEEMQLAYDVINNDPGLEYIAMVSDSIVYTSAPGEPELTDERIQDVLQAVNTACAYCTFEHEGKYANFVYAKKNVQFGCLATQDGIFQRGIVGRLKTQEAVAHLHSLMRHIATSGVMPAPDPDVANEVLQTLQGDNADKERSDFLDKRIALLRIMQTLGIGMSRVDFPIRVHKKRKRDNENSFSIVRGVRRLAEAWRVDLGTW